jgi:putative transposase
MSRYRRLKIEGGAFFFTLALADRGSDLLIRHIERLLANNRRGCPQQVRA